MLSQRIIKFYRPLTEAVYVLQLIVQKFLVSSLIYDENALEFENFLTHSIINELFCLSR